MTEFKINKNISVICEAKKTRNGFKHEATLLINGAERNKTKICYLNRTWERYEFESVIEKLLDETPYLSKAQKSKFLNRAKIQSGKESEEMFGAIGLIAKIGDIFGKTEKEKNDWKKRMLTAGLGKQGLEFPEDWDGLSEEEKKVRLNGAIETIS